MNKRARRVFQPADLIPMVVLAVSCILLIYTLYFTGGKQGSYAVILLDGQEYARFSLEPDVEQQLQVPGDYPLTVLVRDAQVSVTQASCPDQVCVHTGWISRAGAGIVCLPARISIQIVGENMPDARTY